MNQTNSFNCIPQTDPSEILKELHTFYDSLYSSHYTQTSDQAACSFLDQIDIPRLSEQSKETLNQPVTKSELLQNLKSMSHNKSPGLDGLPAEFYIVFFHDIADLLIASLNFSFEQGILSPSQRNGVVTLLPKKDRDPNFVKNYRPISLLTTDYKLLKPWLIALSSFLMILFMKIKMVSWRVEILVVTFVLLLIWLNILTSKIAQVQYSC